SPADLARQFRTHARVLTEILNNELTGEILEKVYQVIGQRLEGLPAVALGPDEQGCKELWQRYAIEDRADEGWQAVLPQFTSDDLGAWMAPANGDGVEGTVYAGLMRD